MLNNDFCDFLERQLSKAFANSSIDSIKNFWCDGILPPTFENQYSKKFVNDNRKVVMTAFVGVSGCKRTLFRYSFRLEFSKLRAFCYSALSTKRLIAIFRDFHSPFVDKGHFCAWL